MKRRMLQKVHNRVLKASAMAASLIFIATGSAIDSVSWTPTIICAGCLLYLAIFAYANFKEGE